MGGTLRRETRHIPMEAQFALENYAGDLSQGSLSEYQVIRHVVMPSVTNGLVKIYIVPKKLSIRLRSTVRH